MPFLPPTAAELDSLANLITVIQAASDKDVQAAVKQMQAVSATTVEYKKKADETLAAAEALSKSAIAGTEANAKAAEKIAADQTKLHADAAALDARTKAVVAQEKALTSKNKTADVDIKARVAEVFNREKAIAELEQITDAAKVKADALIEEYETKIANMKAMIA